MSSLKMGPGILGDLGAEAVPATPRYQALERQMANASEGSMPRKVFNPFHTPLVVADDGTDLYVLGTGDARALDSDHGKSVYTPCVTRVSRAGVVLDVGYYSKGPRLNGDASQIYLWDLMWCDAAKRMFAASFDNSNDQSELLLVSRGPVAFTSLASFESPIVNMAVVGSRLFIGLADGSLLEYNANGPFDSAVNNTSFGTNFFQIVTDADNSRLYLLSQSDNLIGYSDISDGALGSPTTAEFDNGMHMCLAGTGLAVTDSGGSLYKVDNTLTPGGNVDLSENLTLIFGVAYFNGRAYVWGVDGSGLTAIVRVLLSEMAIENTAYFDAPSDGAANDGSGSVLLTFTRAALTDPEGNAKLWLPDPQVTKALISPTGRVGSLDLNDSENPITSVTSSPFVRWV